jgi:hypothetical protein
VALDYSYALLKSGATAILRKLAPACAIAEIALSTATAAAIEPLSPSVVQGSGSCPEPSSVNRALSELISEQGKASLPRNAQVTVGDGGQAFTVSVIAEGKNASRTYADAERDCERRVRFAAVFAVTTLLPPELALGAEPLPDAPPKAGDRAPPPRTARPRRGPAELPPSVLLELGAFGEVGVHLAEPSHVTSWGGEFRAALGRGSYAGTLGIAYAPRAKLTAPELEVDIARIGASAGARAALIERPIALALDAALIGSFERFAGTGLYAPARDSAFELGFRAGVIAAPRRARGVRPFAGIHLVFSPAPREITAAPRGVVAHTPLLWTGVTLGIAIGL